MRVLASVHFLAAGVHLVPALVWGIIADDSWRFLITRRPRSGFFRLLPLLASLMVLHFLLHALVELTPTELEGRAAGLHAAVDGATGVLSTLAMALLRHMVPLLPVREEPPRPAWLVANYGSAIVVSAIILLPFVGIWPAAAPVWLTPDVVAIAYTIVIGGLSLRELRQVAHRAAWRPGAFTVSSSDVMVLAGVLVGAVAMMLAWMAAGAGASLAPLWALALHTGVGLALAVPFAVRMLGEMIQGLLTMAALAGSTAAALAVHVAATHLSSPEGRFLVDLGAWLLFVIALGPGQAWLRAWIDRLVFRRSRDRRRELLAFLRTLSPELGVLECCRRALAELTRVMQVPGAAVLLAGGRGAVAHGRFRLEPLLAVWPDDPAAVRAPPGAGVLDPRELAPRLCGALIEAEVAGLMAITSPRQCWGFVFATEGFILGRVVGDDREAVSAFVGQLALILDGAELLARAVAVERSLAHSEKLAAIGELSARIAHEIRNPVTAARSLAQQLCREPGSPFTTEHAVILAELERVERQVAALLRFARREEFHFEPVDLGELARATVETFRPRLEADEVTVEATAGVVVRADREKLRQVLINLIENALDAMTSAPAGSRALVVAVGNGDGAGTVSVRDNGPGVPADALPHLFEPFFSLKSHGTGLGLAIARRTVEAHGGRITVSSRAGEGTTFAIDLPVAGGAETP